MPNDIIHHQHPGVPPVPADIINHTVTIQGIRFRITTDHPASSYDEPVVVGPDGEAIGPTDLYQLPTRAITGAEIMRRADNPATPDV